MNAHEDEQTRIENEFQAEQAYQAQFDAQCDSVGAADGGKFVIDGWPDTQYEAVSFGATWNGWLTPVVTRATVEELLGDNDHYTIKFADNGTLTVTEPMGDELYDVEIVADTNGNYDLGLLGWCFTEPYIDLD
jgi:hypothetical protein